MRVYRMPWSACSRTGRSTEMMGKVKFELVPGEEDGIYHVPATVMERLDVFIPMRR